MNNIIDKTVCLQLNKLWQPTGMKTVRDAIVQLCGSGAFGNPTDMALNIEYDIDIHGNPIFDNIKSIVPTSWNDWILLPVYDWHLSISTTNREIRVPTVIISMNHSKMPMKTFRNIPSKEEVRLRDGGICQYTGKKLTKSSMTIDHAIPKSRWEEMGMPGSPDCWENVVCCSRDLNEKKGNKLNSEMGIKLLRKPFKPNPMPISALIREAKHRDWSAFLIK